MGYSNSSLVSYTKLSPMHSGTRTHAIDTISIHCMAGNCSVETCGAIFQSKEASSNYGIGSDGRIALYVEEKNRSWCTSNGANDNRAITIEVANDGGAPDWHVSDKAMASLIKLLADICKRNNIKELKWQANKNLIGQVDKQNMTVHRWFDAKACPGDYLYNKHGYIAQEVNKLIKPVTPVTPTNTKIKGALETATLSGTKFTAGGYAYNNKTGNQSVTIGIYKGSTRIKYWTVKGNISRPDIKSKGGPQNCGFAKTDTVNLDAGTYTVKAFIGNTQLSNTKTITVAPKTKVYKATGIAKSFNKNYGSGKTYKVNAKDGLNLRNGGSTSDKLLCTLPYGTKVTWYGYYTGSFKYVVVNDGPFKGSTGFVHQAYLI